MLKTEMSSLWQVMNTLKKRGYTLDFSITDDGKLTCADMNCSYTPEHLHIDKVYRFEGESDPADMSVLYAMHSDNGDKGLLVDAYGVSSAQGPAFVEFIKKVNIQRDVVAPFGKLKVFFMKIWTFIKKLFSWG